MTTRAHRPFLRGVLIALPLVLLGWIATLAVTMRLSDQAPGAFVPFPSAALLTALPDGIAITGRSPVSLTLQSDAPGLTAALYRAGAWLVLPAGLEGCIPAFLREELD